MKVNGLEAIVELETSQKKISVPKATLCAEAGSLLKERDEDWAYEPPAQDGPAR